MHEADTQNIFIQGAISTDLISGIIQQHSINLHTGAYSIFLGQVRSDETGENNVRAIEYTAQTEIAMEKYREIRSSLFGKYPLTGLHAYHSLGKVDAGEICFFVLVASTHRAEAIKACQEAVDRIKAEAARAAVREPSVRGFPKSEVIRALRWNDRRLRFGTASRVQHASPI